MASFVANSGVHKLVPRKEKLIYSQTDHKSRITSKSLIISGEPDGGDQHCAFIWGGHEFGWADYNCDKAG